MPGRLSLALVAIACLANSATSAPRLLDGKETSPLLGWVSFCEQHTAECAVDSNEPDAVVASLPHGDLLADHGECETERQAKEHLEAFLKLWLEPFQPLMAETSGRALVSAEGPPEA